MPACKIQEDFYDKIEATLHRRIGRQLSLAYRILDIGCGACELVEYLAHTYEQFVIGVDISAKEFPKRRRIRGGKIKCIRKDAKNLNFLTDRSIDAAVMMWSFHEMKYPNDVLKEIYRVLRPGGVILIVDFPRGSLAQRLWDEDYYTLSAIRDKLIDTNFKNVKVKLIAKKQIIWAKAKKPAN